MKIAYDFKIRPISSIKSKYHFFMLSDEVKNNSRDPFTKFMFNQKKSKYRLGELSFLSSLWGKYAKLIFTING